MLTFVKMIVMNNLKQVSLKTIDSLLRKVVVTSTASNKRVLKLAVIKWSKKQSLSLIKVIEWNYHTML